ncbi:RNA polymerase sigma factor [Paenibacillus cymbidii]|uniref:RNA polymerase sigma factor n=1 Tax=Paenibacillus cymbidii TaxID=1639034 RepID=UPI00107FE2A4|nr:sigma-70 family RNA polymerase sigma factor [Paenibacillus cymbidii]
MGKEERNIRDEDAIRLTLAGNADAFRAIIEAYQSHVYRAALAVLGNPKDAEDAAQEAFVKLYFSLPGYQGQGFKTWLTRIAVNTAIDHRRKLGRRKETLYQVEAHDESLPYDESQAPESVEEDLLRKERGRLIARYLNEMPASHREIVVAFYMQDKSQRQIAAEQGIELKTVESKLYRARSWMRKHWKEDDFR